MHARDRDFSPEQRRRKREARETTLRAATPLKWVIDIARVYGEIVIFAEIKVSGKINFRYARGKKMAQLRENGAKIAKFSFS